MKIEYFGKDYTFSEQLKKMSDKKCRKLKKYFDGDAVAKFTVTLASNSYKTELVVTFGSNTLRAEAESENPYKNLDVVIPRIETQMGKKKSVWVGKKKGKHNEYPKIEAADREDKEEVVEDFEPPKPEF
ncbi:MAG: ribosome-associated translation inhibitor RaiA [Clostridia bacterium]|nr:ribosome-associated translation inhibitor RaiA [Clostridia bacterium]